MINNIVNYFLSPSYWEKYYPVRREEGTVTGVFQLDLYFPGLRHQFNPKRSLRFFTFLDHIFFNFAIAIRTYFQKVADPRDIAPSMAVGFTINHIAAVVLPAIGGVLWMVDYRIPFVAGAAMAMISLIAVQQIRVPSRQQVS